MLLILNCLVAFIVVRSTLRSALCDFVKNAKGEIVSSFHSMVLV